MVKQRRILRLEAQAIFNCVADRQSSTSVVKTFDHSLFTFVENSMFAREDIHITGSRVLEDRIKLAC